MSVRGIFEAYHWIWASRMAGAARKAMRGHRLSGATNQTAAQTNPKGDHGKSAGFVKSLARIADTRCASFLLGDFSHGLAKPHKSSGQTLR